MAYDGKGSIAIMTGKKLELSQIIIYLITFFSERRNSATFHPLEI